MQVSYGPTGHDKIRKKAGRLMSAGKKATADKGKGHAASVAQRTAGARYKRLQSKGQLK